ncbi:DedA family protein [Quadrisphaera setariae]|uniref:DedA family protein n=1 Tax=Quadrisphaera setariae TaxID=2593304 RepID=A0A5C8Z0G4_9ACTN|nr:VTT domain-containing protein [Quadrisphaera setariae]TXR51615.1 DedA family protein [Quadrisphaera setariae]
MGIGRTALLGLGVLVGSAVPFVPTGEVVSAAATLASGSWLDLVVVFAVVLVASVLGDSTLLLGAGVVSRLVTPAQRAWLGARRLAPAVGRARARIASHAPQAVLTGRLVPGGRAPVIIALGIARYPVGRFMAADALACGAWAGIYVALGALGGRVSGHPLLGIGVAVVCAVALGLGVSQVQRLLQHRRSPSPAA